MARGWVVAALAMSACVLFDPDAEIDDSQTSSGGENDSTATSTATGSATEPGESAGSEDSASTGDPSTTGDWLPDQGPDLCGEDCDIWLPDDCPEGQKCTWVSCEVGSNSWDSSKCRDIQGDAQTGDECEYVDESSLTGNDTCAAGNMCWGKDPDTGLGVCIAFCLGPPDSAHCAGDRVCVYGGGGMFLCVDPCDPLAQDCGDGDVMCLPNTGDPGYVCVLDASGGQAPYGTPCGNANVCNPGLICVDSDAVPEPECSAASGCCSPMCSISGGAPCPGAGQECEPIFAMPPAGYEDVGVCRVPS